MSGLRYCVRAFSSCGERGPLFIAVRRPLTIAASPVAEHKLQTRRLSSCGSRAQLLRGMWNLPRPGLEPLSPALAGRFSTTEPPGKPCVCFLMYYLCEKYFKPITVQYYIVDCVSWVPMLTLLDLQMHSRNGTCSYVGDLLQRQLFP